MHPGYPNYSQPQQQQQPPYPGGPPPPGGYAGGPPPPGGYPPPPQAGQPYNAPPPPHGGAGGFAPPPPVGGAAPPVSAPPPQMYNPQQQPQQQQQQFAPPPAAHPPPPATYAAGPPPPARPGMPPAPGGVAAAPPPQQQPPMGYGAPPPQQQQQQQQQPAAAAAPPPMMMRPAQPVAPVTAPLPAANNNSAPPLPGYSYGAPPATNPPPVAAAAPPPQQPQQPQQYQSGPPPPGGYPPANNNNTSAPPPPGGYGQFSAAGGPPPPPGGFPAGGPPPPPGAMGGAGGPPPPSTASRSMPPPMSGPSAPAPPMFINPQNIAPRSAHPGSIHAAAGHGGTSSGGASVIGQQMANLSMGDPARLPVKWTSEGLDLERPALHSEEGQCQANYMRLTVNAFPNSVALAQRFGLPFGIVIQPMSDQENVPVVNFGSAGVIRCRRCRTYINPFVQFMDAGRRWRCNVCGLLNDLPAEYFCNLDANNRRKDIDERPELKYGTVEFEAPADYMVRAPQPPVYLFLIDVSQRSVQSGMLRIATETIKSCLDQLPGDPRTLIGFMTYDTTFSFYNLRSGLSQPQALVVSDVENPFLPLPTDLLVNLSESRSLVDDLLTKLPTIYNDTDVTESCLGSALQAAYMLMTHIGGKLLVFQSTMPSVGRGALQPREDVKLLGTERESAMLQPATDHYKTLALDCSKQQICVDLFTFPMHYIDLASLSPLSKFTGGQLYHYPSFDGNRDGDVFAQDLRRCLSRNTGFEAVMRVRCTKGVKIHAFHGNYYMRGTDLLALPNVDADKGFACEISHEEQTMTASHVCVQCALLYTTSKGERRIRVHNLNIPIVGDVKDLYATVDSEAMAVVLAKSTVDQALATKLVEAKARLQDRFVQALRSFRAMMQTVALPKQLELLPLMVLAMMKSSALRDGMDIRTDERTALWIAIGSFTLPQTIAYLLPTLFSLHTLTANGANFGGVDNGRVIMPPRHPLSLEHLSPEGLYLMENGTSMMLWIGKSCNPQLLEQLLNVASADRLDSVKINLQRLQTDISYRVNNIVDTIKQSRASPMPLYIVRQGGAAEARFLHQLVEDRSVSTMSYGEWWASLARTLG